MKKLFTQLALSFFLTATFALPSKGQSGTTVPLNFDNFDPVENTDPQYTKGNVYAHIKDPDTLQNKPCMAIVNVVVENDTLSQEKSEFNIKSRQYILIESNNTVRVQDIETKLAVDADGNTDELISKPTRIGKMKTVYLGQDTDESRELQAYYDQCFNLTNISAYRK